MDLSTKTSGFSLVANDPQKLLDLYASLGDLDGHVLQKKVNKYIQDATCTRTSFIVLMHQDSQEAIVQVLGDCSLEDEFRFEVSNSIFEEALKSCDSMTTNVSDLESYFIDIFPANHANSNLFIVPVKNINSEVELFCCLLDYTVGCEEVYKELIVECFRYCLGTIANTVAYEVQRRLHLQCHSLLKGARNLISHLGDVTDLLREIMTEARKLTKAERCSLFLVDEQGDLVSKVFDGVKSTEAVKEVRIKAGQGIAGNVAKSGLLLNIKDAYSHPLFYNEVDKHTGFRTRNILCFPIVNESGVIGVAELCNKMGRSHFDLIDEEVAMAFSIYCGISIMHSLVYKKIQDAQARNKLSNELMMYHMKVEEDSVQKLVDCNEKHEYPDFCSFKFNPRSILVEETPCLCLRMFEEMGFIKHFNIPIKTLARFILYVKKGYRDTPYHNWSHAFAVLHFAFLLLENCKLIEKEHMTPLEGLAMLVSAMCHDIDHRGTTNQFQLYSGNSLASLYSSEGSVMERHHVSQTMCILNTEGCNIIAHLDESVFKQFIDLVSQIILATDMVVHFRLLNEEKGMAANGFDKNNRRHRELLRSLIISCADISDQTKDWSMCRKVATFIYNEFFAQGDLEKAMGVNPMEMMDRDKAKVPELQVEFLHHVVIPVYEVLIELYPECQICLDRIHNNLHCWQKAVTYFEELSKAGKSSIDILSDPQLDNILDLNGSEK